MGKLRFISWFGSPAIIASQESVALPGYEELDIQKGDAANREFLRVTFGDVSETERAKVRKQLEDYCGLDTMGMVEVAKALTQCGI